MKNRFNISKHNILELALLIVGAFLLFKIDFSTEFESDFYHKKEDIYYEYQAAKELKEGINPYDRILESNMLENDKYATQLPLYFYFLSFIRDLAEDNFTGTLEIFRNVLFVSHLLGGVFIYLIFKRIGRPFMGVSAAIFYCFNVWSINSFIFLKQDMIAIALLLMSFYFFRNDNKRWVSYLLFGLSLGIKHIGIFAFPLYLTPFLFKKDSLKKTVINMSVLFFSVLIPIIPLLMDNPVSFVKSMLFSVTRAPFSSEIIFGYSELLVQYNSGFNTGTFFQKVLPRLPLLISSLLAVIMLFTKKIPASFYLFISLLIFSVFNPVIFPQYITWVPPFAMISIVDFLKSNKKI